MTNRTLIIAEAGVNHNGDMNQAKKLIDVAKEAGADIVKFQTFISEQVISSKAQKAEYQVGTTGKAESQLEMVKKLELAFDDFVELRDYADTVGIEFASTGFDLDSLAFLNTMGIRIFKIPSGEITNLPYLQLVGSFNKEVILSTGMATINEIGDAIDVLVKSGASKSKISVLHCNTEYPTPFEDVNLKAMLDIKSKFDVEVGYSDHTLGIEVPIAAVALGATIIEKHFTLDSNAPGPDHKSSLEPKPLMDMIAAIRNIEKAISGSAKKEPSQSEKKNITQVRKSLHLKHAVSRGEICKKEDFLVLRPGNGINPMMLESFVGKEYAHDLEVNHQLDPSDFR